jgi:hypothetical protein
MRMGARRQHAMSNFVDFEPGPLLSRRRVTPGLRGTAGHFPNRSFGPPHRESHPATRREDTMRLFLIIIAGIVGAVLIISIL